MIGALTFLRLGGFGETLVNGRPSSMNKRQEETLWSNFTDALMSTDMMVSTISEIKEGFPHLHTSLFAPNCQMMGKEINEIYGTVFEKVYRYQINR